MNIKIDSKAIKYIRSKDADTITVDLMVGGACIEVGEPIVYIGIPKEPVAKYTKHRISSIDVYLYKGAEPKVKSITITYKNFLGFKSLGVEGIKLW
ncbi:MAG: CC/Se motif family (seleno)protein [Bacillota bacterium]|nr:CC/Se motif family (seleno)protein [Bacillota bacterium]